MRKSIILASVLALAACKATPAVQQQTIAAASTAVITLAEIAAKNNTSVQNVLTKGALICGQINSATGQLVEGTAVALVNAAGVPLSVTGQASGDVAAACAGFGLAPGAAPATMAPAAIPVVVVPAAKLPVVAVSTAPAKA